MLLGIISKKLTYQRKLLEVANQKVRGIQMNVVSSKPKEKFFLRRKDWLVVLK